MTSWRWHLEILAVRHGLWLLPALALLLAAGIAWLVWLPAQQMKLDAARQALARQALARQQRSSHAMIHSAAAAPALPPPAQASASVQRLFALAQQHGLMIAQADYRRQDSGGAGRWQVQVPASGSYPQLRFFLRAAQSIPGLSLDEVNLQRGSTREDGDAGANAGTSVQARMLFSIWYDSAEANP